MIENCGMPGERIYDGIEELPEQAGYYSLLILKESEEDKKSTTNIMTFNNYRFASSKVETKSEKETLLIETSASYSVSARMPGINGMEKMTVPTFNL